MSGRAIVIMGVSGSGKSTLAIALADRLRLEFIEGDDFHPQTNIDKMRAGIELTDADRRPWLAALVAVIDSRKDEMVVTCSALKRSYRDYLRQHCSREVVFLHPLVDEHVLHKRMELRADHFMPESLLQSQLAALESTGGEQGVIELDGTGATDSILEVALTAIEEPGQ